jgi:7-carboxy-7-deazaguanine synthase
MSTDDSHVETSDRVRTEQTKLLVSERFVSLQGEGKLTGIPSAFIRLAGCNMRCTWCDTPYASWEPQGQRVELTELVEWVAGTGVRHVVLTGGEPMLFDGIEPLAAALNAAGMHLTVETAGTVFRDMPIHLLSLSPKLSNSTPRNDPRDPLGVWAARHEAIRTDLEPLRRLLEHAAREELAVQLKFVVSQPSDLAEIHTLLKDLGVPVKAEDILLMPEGTVVPSAERTRWVVEACLAHGYRYAHRLHIELFGNTRGT